jgi:hypothetical protein
MEATLITLDALLSNMEAELRTDMYINISLNCEFEPSQNGDGDEIFLSANTDVRHSLNEISQNSQNGDGDEIFLSANTDVRRSLNEISQNSQNGDGDEIFLSANTDARHSLNKISQNSQKGDGDEIFLSANTDVRHSLDEINSNNQNIGGNEKLPPEKENSSFERSNENAYFTDSDEIFLSIPIDEQSKRKETNLSSSAESGEKTLPLNFSGEKLDDQKQKSHKDSKSETSPSIDLCYDTVEFNSNLNKQDNDEIFLSNYNDTVPAEHATGQRKNEPNQPRYLAIVEEVLVKSITEKPSYIKRKKIPSFKGDEDEINPSTIPSLDLSTISILKEKRELIQIHDSKDKDEKFLSTTNDNGENFSSLDRQKRDELTLTENIRLSNVEIEKLKKGSEDEKFSLTNDQESNSLNQRQIKIRKREILVDPIDLQAYTEEMGIMNKCQLMDTILPGRVHLTMQFIDLVNDLVHKKYENQYPAWAESILEVTAQLINIDPRWELKTVLLTCGHVVLRNYDCTCDPPFFPLRVREREFSKLRAKTITINDLIDRRNLLTRKLMNTILEKVVEENYSQYKLQWVSEVSKIIKQILNIDPGWELKCIKEQFKCLKIEHKVCKCGQQE